MSEEKEIQQNENQAEEPHVFNVGDIVVATIVTEITDLSRDMFGEPLYQMAFAKGLWMKDVIRPATEEEQDNY